MFIFLLGSLLSWLMMHISLNMQSNPTYLVPIAVLIGSVCVCIFHTINTSKTQTSGLLTIVNLIVRPLCTFLIACIVLIPQFSEHVYQTIAWAVLASISVELIVRHISKHIRCKDAQIILSAFGAVLIISFGFVLIDIATAFDLSKGKTFINALTVSQENLASLSFLWILIFQSVTTYLKNE